MSASPHGHRGRGWLWFAVVPGIGGAVAAMAELSGANRPGPATITLWLTVAVLAIALPAILLLVEPLAAGAAAWRIRLLLGDRWPVTGCSDLRAGESGHRSAFLLSALVR